jgi:tetraacyldisaccharide 4'-kinase
MLARKARGISIVVGSDRHSCGIHAIERLGADCIILDDGFQHLGLRRDLDLLLMDSSRPFGTGELLPAGTLRETPDQIARADIVMFTRWDRRSNGESHRARVASVIGEDKIVKASHKFAGLSEAYRGSERALTPVGVTRATGAAGSEDPRGPVTGVRLSGTAEGEPALLVTGIADWKSFRETVEGAGFEARDHIRFGDHHRYRERDVRSIQARASRCGAALVLTTEKDAVRLPPEVKEIEIPVLCARVELEIEEGLDVLREALCGIFS